MHIQTDGHTTFNPAYSHQAVDLQDSQQQERQCSSDRMGLLLLLTSSLLSSYFHPGIVVDAQRSFAIRNIVLSLEPSTNVTRDTNVTVRCKAIVSSSGSEVLSREYTIYKDSQKVYTKNSSTSEDLLYPLPGARVSNTGKYRCKINIEGKEKTSEATKLTVTGLSKPVLHLNKYVVNEEEEVTASCTAPGETGSIFFYFYEDSKEILEDRVNSNQLEAKFRFSSIGHHTINCAYAVLIIPDSFKSEQSNMITVSVKELSITPVLEIFSQSRVYEGDQLNISCTIRNSVNSSVHITHNLYLSHGTKLLSSGETKVNHSMVALAKDPVDFECRLEMGHVDKVTTKMVSVTELFSAPTLTMSPAEVFQKEYMTLTCKSENYASERITREELSYTLKPPDIPLTSMKPGVFSGKALQFDFNYTCVAQAKGIMKHSDTLTVYPKVSVSIPKISVVGKAVLGQPFRILCQSDTGSFPINYTLIRDYEQLSTTTVKLPPQEALFTVTISRPDEISKYMCRAKNNHREALLSKRLNATVIVPLTDPTLTVLPHIPEISEGDHLYLICGTKGSPPVTFKWYRDGNKQPLFTTTTDKNNTHYQVSHLSKEHSGTYYCEAVNHANIVVRSEKVTIEVRMALWKKAVIGGVCLVVVSMLVVACVLYFKSKRVRVVRAAVSVWSERPPEAANDEESSVVSSEPDVEYTEVVHPQPVDTVRVPLRKGTDTVYSELKNLPHGDADHHDYGSVEYAELNSDRPEISHHLPEAHDPQDLPVPVD
ncbi:platelet endothelial cell adhesion molecule isoform X2 [Hippoglossus stenolepis]|uniref:platelet endothelial cell adhesion molecule isoform X2 n=1 Tax=Hippoglossus stenolepis TaxID=195615 RepID=UPI001FAF5F5C|nr:platelet endothelial cell adhesion molecule isoform X2 [Hippoglossus stenolepis]